MSKSELHRRTLGLLKKAFPFEKIRESVMIKHNGRYLEFDIQLVSLGCMVECHGKQHYERSSFFHSSKEDFLRQRQRDIEKQVWCGDNDFTYVEIPYSEKLDVDSIKEKIIELINGE